RWALCFILYDRSRRSRPEQNLRDVEGRFGLPRCVGLRPQRTDDYQFRSHADAVLYVSANGSALDYGARRVEAAHHLSARQGAKRAVQRHRLVTFLARRRASCIGRVSSLAIGTAFLAVSWIGSARLGAVARARWFSDLRMR